MITSTQQVMAVTAINEEDKFKHKEFKFSGEETFPLQSNTNDHIEIFTTRRK